MIEIDFSIPPRQDAPGDAVLFAVIKAAFSKRRKTLKNALSTGELPLTAAQASRALENAGILPTRRAETLSTDEFVVLGRAVQAELLQ